MSTATTSIPQPLTGMEIKRGIAVRMTQGLPADVQEALREQIIAGLGKTCSLTAGTAYAKFSATWTLRYLKTPFELNATWHVQGLLNDFGRVTPFGIGGHMGLFDFALIAVKGSVTELSGTIDEVPPDRFRRETDQPIPKPTELKPPEPEKSTFSRSTRGSGKRRQV